MILTDWHPSFFENHAHNTKRKFALGDRNDPRPQGEMQSSIAVPVGSCYLFATDAVEETQQEGQSF